MPRVIPFVSIILLIILIFGGIFLWWPKYENFKEFSFELENKNVALKQKEKHFSQLNDISKKLEEHREQLAKIDSALPQEISKPELFNLIQEESSKNGLIFKKIGSGDISSSQAKEEGIKEISFSFSVSGSYQAFKNFLSSLYQNSKVITVKSINFSSSDKEGDLLNFDLTLAAYNYQKPEIKEGVPRE